MTERSLDKFASNSAHLRLESDNNCRNRINSVFRLKLRDLQEIRNKKKLSQSMIRSNEILLGADFKNSLPKESAKIGNTDICNQFNEKFNANLDSLDKTENEFKMSFSNKKNSRYDENTPTTNFVKNSIQDIITPVVQISYNQIKNAKSKGETIENKIQRTLSSKQNSKIDIIQTVNTLNRALSRKSKSGSRGDILARSENISSNTDNLNYDDEDDGTDERIPDGDILNQVSIPITDSQHGKRSMSEVQKSIAHTISVSKVPHVIGCQGKDRHRNHYQGFTILNGIKTVSLNELTGSTKSGGQSSGRPLVSSGYPGNLSTNVSTRVQSQGDKLNLKLNSSANNNSISSLKLNDKQLHIDL